jgi:hypothetical protein
MDHTTGRGQAFPSVKQEKVGRRFATDSRTRHLKRPIGTTLARIAVPYLCLVHAGIGHIMAAQRGLRSDIELPDIEAARADPPAQNLRVLRPSLFQLPWP